MFGGNFAPLGWALCQGQTVAIAENDALFSLIGTTYGGDGQQTFQLPDLQSRVPLHQGQGTGLSNYVVGQNGGVEQVTLTVNQMPQHTHTVTADNNNGNNGNPTNQYFAKTLTDTVYSAASGTPDPPVFRTMNPGTLPVQGGNQPHTNIQPVLAINYIISLFGIYPSPT